MASTKNLRSSRATVGGRSPIEPQGAGRTRFSARNARHATSTTNMAEDTAHPVLSSKSPNATTTSITEGSTAESSTTVDGSAEADEHEDEDAEMTDVVAPSGEGTLPVEADHAMDVTSLAGQTSQSSNKDVIRDQNNQHDTNDSKMKEVIAGRIVDDLGNYELTNDLSDDVDDDVDADADADAESEAGDSATSVAGLDFDNDDGYDDIDNISNDSDDSRAFEAEIEREIQAEGEQAIDWDDHRTYQYDENWNTGLYDLGQADSTMEPMADFDLYEVLNARLSHSDPEVSKPAFEDFTDRAFFGDSSASSVLDTPETSPRPSHAAPVVPAFVDPTQVEGLGGPDGEETDDDEDLEANESSIISPSVSASNIRESRLINRKPQPPQDDSDLPPLRRIACNPRRAVAVTSDSPLGRCIKYLTPRGRAYRWITLRRSAPNSRPSSVLSSPTMINFDDAIMHGNTRTGAHVTDIIHGYAFSLRHCRNQSADELATPNRFYERFHTSFNTQEDWTLHDVQGLAEVEEDAMQLVDFSECVEPVLQVGDSQGLQSQSSTNEGNLSTFGLSPAITDDMLRTPTNQTHYRTNSSLSTSLTNGLRVLPLDDSSSPKKRRLSERSNTAPDLGMSPLEKKTRLTTLSDAID